VQARVPRDLEEAAEEAPDLHDVAPHAELAQDRDLRPEGLDLDPRHLVESLRGIPLFGVGLLDVDRARTGRAQE
jgi:hypothetical protein